MERQGHKICFLCLNDTGGSAGVKFKCGGESPTILFSYLLDVIATSTHSNIRSTQRDILRAFDSGELRLCDQCQYYSEKIGQVHLQLEVLQMKIINILNGIQQQVRSAPRFGSDIWTKTRLKLGTQDNNALELFSLFNNIRQSFASQTISEGTRVRLSRLENCSSSLDKDFRIKEEFENVGWQEETPCNDGSDNDINEMEMETEVHVENSDRGLGDGENLIQRTVLRKPWKKRMPNPLSSDSELDSDELVDDEAQVDSEGRPQDDNEMWHGMSLRRRRRKKYRNLAGDCAMSEDDNEVVEDNDSDPDFLVPQKLICSDSGTQKKEKKPSQKSLIKKARQLAKMEREIRREMREKSREKRCWRCDICWEMIYYKDIKNHLPTHLEFEKFYECDVCVYKFDKRVFGSFKGLVWHFLLARGHPNKMKCILCPDQTEFKIRKLPKHLFDDHKVTHSKLKCKEANCSKEFFDPVSLQVHLREDHREKHFPCLKCEKSFRTENQLKVHSKSHENRIHQCAFCPKTFPTKFFWMFTKRHTLNHHYMAYGHVPSVKIQ